MEIVLGTEEPPQNGNSVAAFNSMDKYLSRKATAEPSEIWTTLHARLDTNSSTARTTSYPSRGSDGYL
ncbi:hypothetical protein L873DRAFT_1804720 [Choiromyces venosus 120613-1]|uniref:Uncharacterized protein n=1 Tax=Choiromyces venosus 120613-1 TaxID=1336337 RepID=A0A3N4JF06_9PEZI|nr:hypothetical protein L873DRAFT_1817598 [Choiromyces venosus 120613-1]RPA98325.1 hypothetical protein L873DRAFT_1808652 [Choiromyces venosus 120613-1]RPB00655.1 hypothetical protein L873DRAFT_1804720 [Choiromyces venosus 120613-1]